MQWYYYLGALIAGAFLANAVPHFVQGVSGNKFPTVFSKPRGIGLSSPTMNVLWAFFNILVGYGLCRLCRVSFENNLSMLAFFSGVAFTSTGLSIRFAGKHKE